MSDTESQLEMMLEAYKALRAKDPTNSLLRLITLHAHEREFTFSPDYDRRCVRESDQHNVQGYARYTFALKAVINGEDPQLLDTMPPCAY